MSLFAVTTADAIARIDLNDPDDGNAITRAGMLELAHTVADLGQRPEVNAIVLESRGPIFCRGRNPKGENLEGLTPFEIRERSMGAVLGVYEAMSAAPIPVVALIQGPAVGFGSALAGGADITLASDAARFSFPEINHGIAPTLAMSAVLRKVPAKALSYLIYSGEEISAEQGVTFGLASTVFPAAEFKARCDAFLARLVSKPRLNLRTIKQYQRYAADVPAAMATEYAGTLMGLVRTSL
jgi:enoyl-CoA hydratase/carnithine racemase